jgi:hypothetical protein
VRALTEATEGAGENMGTGVEVAGKPGLVARSVGWTGTWGLHSRMNPYVVGILRGRPRHQTSHCFAQGYPETHEDSSDR